MGSGDRYQYAWVWVYLNYNVQALLDEWAAAGWELHSSSMAQTGYGAGIKTGIGLIWQRRVDPGAPATVAPEA